MIIKSFFDNDLYKFTMQQAVLHYYPQATAEYRFKNRGRHKFDRGFLTRLQEQIDNMGALEPDHRELVFLSNLHFIKPWYLNYLKMYRFKCSQVSCSLGDGDLSLTVKGPWHETILWEVPLMAIISELYFGYVEHEWDTNTSKEKQKTRAIGKNQKLCAEGCHWADFGTRRRRSYEIHNQIIHAIRMSTPEGTGGFVGTSNVHMAYKYSTKPIGTMAHEWVQAISALESVNHANRYMMDKWSEFYQGNLGIALTDTYGLRAFLVDFTPLHAKLFDGVRHDSGCPYELADRIRATYQSFGIDPKSKTIVFSDGLDVDTAISIKIYCDKIGIGCSFGIGTNITNDFPGSPALNMVIKLWAINGMPVVKLSEDVGKANGDPKAIAAVKTIYGV
jgi:nicotinate phosphoribosyltransferase